MSWHYRGGTTPAPTASEVAKGLEGTRNLWEYDGANYNEEKAPQTKPAKLKAKKGTQHDTR